MNAHQVLFVDDEPHVLSGLRRMLRGRGDWEMTFVESAELALAHLESEPVDVVVSDMRMPGMDGGELLSRVRKLYPSTARLILSGHADREDIIAAVGPTQQFLSKPCDANILVGAITRVLAVRDLVLDERLRGILGDVEALPKVPSVHDNLIEVLLRPDSRLTDVITILESDLALCAEILKIVNSAFFGVSRHVETVERAASLLGLDAIRTLAMSGKVFGPGATPPETLDLAALRQAGMGAAGYAKAIADSEGCAPDTAGQAFLAALLRDLGMLVLAANVGAYDQVSAVPAQDQWARRQAELDAFGCTVPKASAYLLGLWGFSEPVVEALARQPASPDDPDATLVARVVSFAHQRAHTSHVAADPGAGAWLDEARNQRWNDVCDTADDHHQGAHA